MTLAVTGWGCVTPAGAGAAALFAAWRDRRCAIREVRRFDTSALRVHLAGEMPEPGGEGLRGPRHLRSALDEAMAASGLPRGSRVLVYVATAKGFLENGTQVEERHPAADVGLPGRFVETELRERHGCVPLRTMTVSTACASGVTALAMALAETRRSGASGQYDAILCVGVDLLSDFVYRGFAALCAVDTVPCRPFDIHRAGMSASEAAAAVVLEAEPRARSRGAIVRGRLHGAGLSNDALHPTAPSRGGEGMARAIREALRAAETTSSESPQRAIRLGHVHAHGTATVFNDAMELRALESAFGDAARATPVTTLKGTIGHAFGPSGLVEVIASLEAVGTGVVPAITGLTVPEGTLDVLTESRPLTSPHFLKMSAGFGGFNAALFAEGVLP